VSTSCTLWLHKGQRAALKPEQNSTCSGFVWLSAASVFGKTLEIQVRELTFLVLREQSPIGVIGITAEADPEALI
jgi:hypothetical protein